MSAGDEAEGSLHPAVAHHVVNTLGWPSLRPLQQEAVEPLMAGEHALLLAPTAGGKTEAAVFPLLSRMLTDDWRGLSVLYVCPLRALLNNLHDRLSHYAGLVGREVGLWHGDVGQSARQRLRDSPPDILLTTPESLESMLVSRRVEHRSLFAGVRVVVVDEIHAFAGDDRGWHLLAVLARLERIAGRRLQRVGLSATVGNPGALLDWLMGGAGGDSAAARVINPSVEGPGQPDVTIDYVGSLSNAALVISRLHRGGKRLVFADSRARVEQLAAELRALDVTTFLSHGSLGREERRRAEAAFASERDCVIAATSTLELGIDIGDLDRVIQIDAPASVAAFLQRLGRTGRRAGTVPNTLFLALSDESLLHTTALALLWGRGYVESVEPPPLPAHLLAQQVLALALQEHGVGRRTWPDWLGKPCVLGDDTAAMADRTVAHMLVVGLLHEDSGILSVGREGEENYGRRNFLELLSVFTAPPMFTVLHGQREIGQVPDTTLQFVESEYRPLLLAGRSWAIRHIDWRRRLLHVEPTDQRGVANWFGSDRALPAPLCLAVREVLSGIEPGRVCMSQRATEQLAGLREEYGWVEAGSTALRQGPDGRWVWWTFAGLQANVWLGAALAGLRGGEGLPRDNLKLRLPEAANHHEALAAIRAIDVAQVGLGPWLSRNVMRELKFSEALPEWLALAVLERRFGGRDYARRAAGEPCAVVNA